MSEFNRDIDLEEKRREKRIKKESKLTFEVISDDRDLKNKKIYYTFTKDISLNGINIRTDTFLPADTLIRIDLPLPKMHKTISVRGRVRWVKNLYEDEVFEIGLEFVDVPQEVITSLIGHLYGQ
jgi:c-di-GMP-binding flagellar brake protein YcgR